MALEIVWTAGAERDLLEIHQQLLDALEEDPALAARVLEKPLESSLELIREYPAIAPKIRGSQRLRRALFGPGNHYGLFYSVENRGIIIHALLDLKQNPAWIRKRLQNL